MHHLIRQLVNKVMHGFAGSGVSIDDHGQLCLPDGLCPARVHRFIEQMTDERFESPRDAMHALFARLGMNPHAIHLLDQILDANGGVDFSTATRHAPALLAALPEFKRIPRRFRDFLVEDLALASASCVDLEEAVASARQVAAERIGCAPVWDVILADSAGVSALGRPWRETMAAA